MNHHADVEMSETPYAHEYGLISTFYAGRQAERSGVPYIQHIEKGLKILSAIEASDAAKKAYCLHPLFQAGADLATMLKAVSQPPTDPYALALAVEYRSVANEYLSHRQLNSVDEIRLSPLKEVNDMLVADKIQNFSDFLIHHYHTHPRSAELYLYFMNWFQRLGIGRTYPELLSLM